MYDYASHQLYQRPTPEHVSSINFIYRLFIFLLPFDPIVESIFADGLHLVTF